MRVQLLVADRGRSQFADFLLEQFHLLFRGAAEFRAAGEQGHRAPVQLPEQGILEAVPQLVARALRIGEGEQREQVQILPGLDLPCKVFDDRGVVEVAPLRQAGHEQVVFDEEPQRVRGRAIQPQPFRRAQRHLRADFRMAAFFVAFRLADIVQQQRQVKQAGPVQPLEERRIIFIRRLRRLPDFVELFQADQRVLVGRVLMIEFMLHQAGELAELGDVFAEQVHLVHRPQNRGDFPAPFQDGQERFADVFVVQKVTVHEGKLVADELRKVGMQGHPPLLCVKENAHEPARRVAKNPVGDGMNLALDEFETVHHLRRQVAFGQPGAQGQPARRRRGQRHALFQRARDEVNVPHVRIKVAHEFLNAQTRRTFGVTQRMRHGGLDVLSQNVERTADLVMQFRPHAQQKTVGGFELFAFRLGHEFARLQVLEGAGAVFEERHPEQVLKIAQAPATVLDVRLLHARRVAILVAPRRLVLDAGRDILVLVAGDAFGNDQLLKFVEQRLVANDEARLDEGGLGLHVGVRHLHAVIQAADRMPDFQAEIPQGIQHPINQLGQMRQRPVDRDLAEVQKHEINVAVRIQFCAAVATDGHQRDGRKLFLRLRRKAGTRVVPKVPQQFVEDGRAGLADFQTAGPAVMLQLQPVGLDLEKTLVTRELLRRVAPRRGGQAFLGVGLDFFQQVLHGRISCGENDLKASAATVG